MLVSNVAEKQEEQIIEKLGPAKRVSFDEQGNPTKAALGFAKGQGLEISELETIVTDKGEYICASKKIAGEETASLLPGDHPEVHPLYSLPEIDALVEPGDPLRKAHSLDSCTLRFGSDTSKTRN